MKTLLQKIKKQYIKRQGEMGICGAMFLLLEDKEITIDQYNRIRDILKATADEKTLFYNFAGFVSDDKTQFLWPIEDVESRVQWLDEQINNLK